MTDMSLERAAMRGILSEKKDEASKMRMRIDGNCAAIRQGLNPFICPVDEMEIPQIAAQMDELVEAWGKYQALKLEIERLERELR